MKKKSAPSDFSSRLDVLVSRLSTFEAILVEVIICLIIFISVMTPKTAQASTPGRASLAVSWSQPNAAYVTSTYTNGANTNVYCDTLSAGSSATSCTLGPFFGNPGTINYVVKEKNTQYPIKDGSKATYLSGGLAYAKISWTWTYELQVYPENAGGCANAMTECRKTPFSTNSASMSQVHDNLIAGRNYRVIVCLTSCTYFAPQLKSYTEVTGTPATALKVSNFSATCNAFGLVNADFTWNRASGRSYDVQFLDKSTDASWPSGVNVPFGTNPNKLSVTDLFPNQAYHFRVNSRITGTTMWDTSDTVNFNVPACTVPNKLVTAPAVLTSPVAANLAGMSCPAGSSGVTVNFKWQAPTISGGTYDNTIYLDYSKSNNNFAAGTFTGIPVAPTSTTYGETNFAGSTPYYWRINAKVANSNPAQWVTSAVGQFITPPCSATKPPVTTKAVPVVKPAMSCVGSSPVNVTFSWQPATITGGTYDYPMYLDYSVYDNGFAPGTFKGIPLQPSFTGLILSGFASNVKYYWRLNYHVADSNPAQWVTSDKATFLALSCETSGTTGFPSPLFRPTDSGSHFAWTNVVPAGSTHWQAVGEVTADEDTSYISSTVDGQVDSYKHNPSGIAAGTPILGVRVSVRAKYVTPGANNVVSPAIISGGKRVNSDRTMAPGAYQEYSATFATDPATNLPWTVAGVDASEIGVRKSYAGADVRVTQIWATVIYNGGPLLTPMSCSRADLDKDGGVDISDVSLLSKNYTPGKTYNSAYDMNGDGIVNYSDASLALNYYGSDCVASTGVVNTVCTAIGAGSIVDVTFNWIPANGDPGIKTQWLDFDTSDHGMGGGWPKPPLDYEFKPGVATSIKHAFPQGTTYFWRVNTQYADGSWKSSKTPSTFTTKDCTPVPTNLKATPATTQKLADGTSCASSPYSVAFGWSNPNNGVGWYMDVSTNSGFPPGGFSNNNIDGNTVLLTTGQNFNPPFQFLPGQTYYWRIFNGVKAYGGNSFSVTPCPTVTDPGGGATDFNPDSFKTKLKSVLGSQQIIIPDNYGQNGSLVVFADVLFGMAGAESGWNQGLCNSSDHCGIFQYSASTWTSHAATANAYLKNSKVYSRYNGWDQMDVAIAVLKNDGCEPNGSGCVPTLWQNWQLDFDGTTPDWNNF